MLVSSFVPKPVLISKATVFEKQVITKTIGIAIFAGVRYGEAAIARAVQRLCLRGVQLAGHCYSEKRHWVSRPLCWDDEHG